MAEQPIVSEVRAAESDVAAVKDEMTAQATQGAVAGTPIDRIPYNQQLVLLEASGMYTKRIANTDRCIRTIEVPQPGGSTLKFHCSRPCVSVGDQRLCPDHNKDFFQPNQTGLGPRPRATNSASIPLTKGEADELAKVQNTRQVVAAAVVVDDSQVTLKFGLGELADSNVLAVFAQRATEALDALPCNSVRQMKTIVAIQEKIAKLAKRGKHD